MVNGKKVIAFTLRDVLAGVTIRNIDTFNYLAKNELKLDDETLISSEDVLSETFIKEQARTVGMTMFANMIGSTADIKDCPPILGVRQALLKLLSKYYVLILADTEEFTATKDWLIAYSDMIPFHAITTDAHINNYGIDYLVTAEKKFLDLFDPCEDEKTFLVEYPYNIDVNADFYIDNLEDLMEILGVE